MIWNREIIDDRGAIRVVQETLTDGSCVFNVWLDQPYGTLSGPRMRTDWCCANERAALDLADALEENPSVSVYSVER